METYRATRALLDKFADFVAMAWARLEKRKNQEFGAAFFSFQGRSDVLHIWPRRLFGKLLSEESSEMSEDWGGATIYSYRRATMGSTRNARRAGIHAARNATANSTARAAATGRGSWTGPWNRSACKSREVNQLPSKPIIPPASVQRATRPSINNRIACGVAP